jgi:hypothetical protein
MDVGSHHRAPRRAAALAFTALAFAAPRSYAWDFTRFVLHQEIIQDAGAPRGRMDGFLDTTFQVMGPQWHAALTVGNYATGLRAGGFLRDRRGSTYGATLQRRTQGFLDDTSLGFETSQKFERFVAQAGLRFLWPDHPEAANVAVIPAAGAELYYDDWSYIAVGLAFDPRRGSGTTLRILNRLGSDRAHLDLGLAPRTDGVVNWSVQARWRLVFAGFARERDFDFSGFDRNVWFAGFHYDFTAAP